MSKSVGLEEFLPIFQEVFNRDDIVLTRELSAADFDAWDSLSNIRLLVAVEEAFGVRFTSDEIASLRNVGELAELVGKKRS